ncbi:MAG: DoxX family membrane protein [Desulfobacterales bacterium]|nr:DoxX family membrane protein [Desulfobacterales bacterium]
MVTEKGYKEHVLKGTELVSRVVVGVLFIYAGWVKGMDVYGFSKTVYGYGLLPGVLVNGVAIVLPWVEVVAGVCLVAGIWPRASSGVVGILLGLFMGAILFNMMRGYTFDCGCFGAESGETGWGTVIRDVAMLLPMLWVLLYRGKRWLCLAEQG